MTRISFSSACLLSLALLSSACKNDDAQDSGVDSEDTQDTSLPDGPPRLISLGASEVVSNELNNVLHIIPLNDGSIVLAEADAPPATRGKMLVITPEGELHTLIEDIPVVSFTHDVTYMGPDGMTLMPDGQTMLWSLFRGAGDIQPVEDDPDWDPSAGSLIYEVPLYNASGELMPTVKPADLNLWTQSRTDFIYDLAWKEPNELWATEPGKNSLYVYESDGERTAVAWPIDKIAIETVGDQTEVEAVPTGLALLNGQPVVAQLGGGIYREDGVTPTGERHGQRVGRVSMLTDQGFEHLAEGLPSVLDVVSVGDSLILGCHDFYAKTEQLGFIYQLLPDGEVRELHSFSEFPNSIASTGDYLYVMTKSGSLLRYPLIFETQE